MPKMAPEAPTATGGIRSCPLGWATNATKA